MTIPSTDAALELRGLACARGERLLFAGFDLQVRNGEVVWLRGANGRGKTTLLRTLAGLSAPAGGAIVRRGVAGARPPVYLAHANALKEELSAAESLRFLLRLAAIEPADEVLHRSLARLGVADRRDAPVRTLSQGQRRRVALARLAADPAPSLWLLDEPYDALDADASRTLDALIGEHARRGGLTLLASHVPLVFRDPAPREVAVGAA